MKNAIFPGSFDPFTYGHLDVVKKACDMFNEVVVLICSNPDKHRKFDASVAQKAITSALHNEGIANCRAVVYNGLVETILVQEGVLCGSQKIFKQKTRFAFLCFMTSGL